MDHIESGRLHRFERSIEKTSEVSNKVFLGQVLAVGCTLAGAVGMGLSYLALNSGREREVLAGAAGFVAGAVLIGSGLISFCLLVRAQD